MTELAIAPTPPQRRSTLVERVAQRFDVDADKLMHTLKTTCFKQAKDAPPITNEQMMGLLIVAEQYHLNPFTRELFAFDDKRGGIIPYVSIDGWARIVNEHPQFDGMEFTWDHDEGSMTCAIYRKDRAHPTTVTEYLIECKRSTTPWTQAPRRMLRHKAMIQAGRLAFGFAGIHDQDDAERIRDGGLVERVDQPSSQRSHLQQVLHTTPEQREAAQEYFDASMQTSLPELMAEMNEANSLDEATEILDRGRSALEPEEFAELESVFSELVQRP